MIARHLVVLLLAAGCAPRPLHTIPVGLLIAGDAAAVGNLPKTAVEGLELTIVAMPPPAPVAADPNAAAITRARAAYARGDFDLCHAELAGVDVTRLLAAHERTLAARTLMVDAACAWGAMDRGSAQTLAARMASYGLALPEIAVSPDVERVIGEAVTTSGAAKRTPLAVTGEPGARLSVDGREAGCALPCTIDLAPGDHVLAVDADGYQPAVKVVRAPQATTAIPQQAASTELAAQQWGARIGRGLPATDPVGARLIGTLASGSRVAFVDGDTRLTGALVVDGKLVASATRDRGEGAALVRELAYDGGLLKRPALWQRPWFWIAVSGAAVAIGSTIIAITYQRPIKTSVGF